MTPCSGKGSEQPAGGNEPGDPGQRIGVSVHEEHESCQPHAVEDRTDHHPLVAVMLVFLESAAVCRHDEHECGNEHVTKDVESFTLGAFRDDLLDGPEVGNQKAKQPQLHAGPLKQTKALDALVKREIFF